MKKPQHSESTPAGAEGRARVRELLAQAGSDEPGATHVALAEEAVHLADSLGDVELAYQAREVLIHAACFSGMEDRQLAPFTWCLAQHDRDPQKFPADKILWYYKWILSEVVEWPRLPLADIRSMMDDLDRRSREHGYSLRSVFKKRLDLAMMIGDASEARSQFQKWRSAPRDPLSDCPACDCGFEVSYRVFLNEDEIALETARPLLDGRMKCRVVPRVTLAKVLVPLLRLGRHAEAMDCHRRGHRMSVRNRKWTFDAALHITFLALTDNPAKALRLLETHLPWPHASLSADHSNVFLFVLAARFLMERLRAGGRKSVTLHVPTSFPAHQEKGKYDVAALESWFEAEARRIAARFDARHQTGNFARQVEENLGLSALVYPMPLRSPRNTSEDRQP